MDLKVAESEKDKIDTTCGFSDPSLLTVFPLDFYRTSQNN